MNSNEPTTLQPQIEAVEEASKQLDRTAPPEDAEQATNEAPQPTESTEADVNNNSPDMANLIAEAEQRGYLRGRNAAIEELMKEPDVYGSLTPSKEKPTTTATQQYSILSNMRPSIWDL